MATSLAESHELVDDELEREVTEAESMSTLSLLNRSEIDSQVATARAYPRSIKRFLNEAMQMVTLTEEIAGECTYMLPRGGKKIMGPSARFAEIVASAWGNCRAGARVVEEQERFIVAQGVFNDVQRNVVVTYEVRRRITDSKGNRYNDDMIGVTSNAACSIAMRNAILKGVPKAFWKQLHDESMRVVRGDVTTLAERRDKLMSAFGLYGATEKQVLQLIGVDGREDVTLDHLVELRAIYTALKEGETSIEQLLDKRGDIAGSKVGRSSLNEKLDAAVKAKAVKKDPPSGSPSQATPEEVADQAKEKKSGLFEKGSPRPE